MLLDNASRESLSVEPWVLAVAGDTENIALHIDLDLGQSSEVCVGVVQRTHSRVDADGRQILVENTFGSYVEISLG